ncbi:MAG: monovalent cation/H+ antiporter subunit D family protein [Maricaulaceae bacterium]
MSLTALVSLAPAWLIAHGAAWIVVAPLVGAPVAALLSGGRAAWAFTVFVTGFAFLTALVLQGVVQDQGLVSYALGGWLAPVGIEYRVDAASGLVLMLVTGIGFACAFAGLPSVTAEIAPRQRALFYSAFLVCFAGLVGVVITGDAFNMFVFLEISSLSTYVLIAMGAGRDRRALTAAYDYLILGTIGATFFVIGVGFLYAATGSLNMADIAQRLEGQTGSATVQAGFAFIVVGLGLKTALFPLHTWLPSAYAYAPSFITAFLAATATKAAFYALARFLFSVFNPEYDFEALAFTLVLAPFAAVAMVVCSAQAIFQEDARKLLAYSSVAQVGYMLLGLSMANAEGAAAGLLHLFNHALMKGALFLAISAVSLRYGATLVKDFRGVGQTMPLTMAGFVIAGLSLIGVPLTAGFVSKWYLLEAALAKGWSWAVGVIAVSSFMAAVYVWRIVETAYLRPAPAQTPAPMAARPPWPLLAGLGVLVLANIAFGVDAGAPRAWAQAAAEALFNGAVAP